MNYTDDIFTFPYVGYYASLRESRGEIIGTVQLPEGTVEVDSYVGDKQPGITRMEFVSGGRVYRRIRFSFHSRRYLITLAKRFVRDVLEGRAG